MSRSPKDSNIRLIKWYVWLGYYSFEYDFFVNTSKSDYRTLMTRSGKLESTFISTLLVGIL